MNKEFFSSILVLFALLVGAFYYSSPIQSPIISSLNSFKSYYHNTTQYISNTIDEHFIQAQNIKDLRSKLKHLKNNDIKVLALENELQNLYKLQKSSLKTSTNLKLVRSISYQKFGDFNKIWIEIPDYNSSKIYGLVHNNTVAGIVINYKNKALALLNKDIKSAYSVYVGKSNAPGITHGNNNENLVVNFIPAWYEINAGDEVISSGLDNIFIKGLKVGKVLTVSSSQGYQTAIIQPYYKSNEPSYFQLIREVR